MAGHRCMSPRRTQPSLLHARDRSTRRAYHGQCRQGSGGQCAIPLGTKVMYKQGPVSSEGPGLEARPLFVPRGCRARSTLPTMRSDRRHCAFAPQSLLSPVPRGRWPVTRRSSTPLTSSLSSRPTSWIRASVRRKIEALAGVCTYLGQAAERIGS